MVTSIFSPSTGTTANWLAGALEDIRNSQLVGGMMGALGTAAKSKPGSISSFLNNNSTLSTQFALINQNSTVSATTLALQMGDAVKQAAADAKMKKAIEDFSAASHAVQPKNVLDPVIYFEDGSTLDTNANILTNSKGKKFDALTGRPYTDPAAIIQMANGAYLDTMNNILTMPDGSQIDTITGLVISVTA